MLIKPKTIQYRWVIVFSSFVVFALSVTVSYNCWGVFTIPITENLSISRNDFSRLFTFLLIGQMLSSFLFGKILNKISGTAFLRVSTAALTAMVLLMSYVNSSVAIWIIGFVIGLFLSGNSYLMFSVVISNWFIKDSGLITGIVMMSSGVLSVILLPFSNYLITILGWRIALRILAGIMLVFDLPLALFLLYASPYEVGLKPYGSVQNTPTNNTEYFEETDSKFIFKTPVFQLFMLFSFGLFLLDGLTPTIVPFLCDYGYTSSFAANISALGMGAVSIGRILGGKICDKFEIKSVFWVFSLLSGLLFLGLIGATYYIIFCMLIIIGQGIQKAEASVCYPLIIKELFGKKNFAEIYGQIKGITSAICAVTPVIYGFLYDKFGGYLVSYYLFLAIYLLSLICLFFTLRSNRYFSKG